jgi:hypothetical protein
MIASSPLSSSLLCSSHPQLVQRIEKLRVSKERSRRFAQKKERSRGALNFPGAGWRQVINTKSASPRGRGRHGSLSRQLVTISAIVQAWL